MKTIWALVRPYVTVARATTFLTALITPILAAVVAWLALQLAKIGVTLDETQTLAALGTVFAGVIATVVPIVRKFIDNRTQFEVAMIDAGQAHLIGGKSISSQTKLDDDYILSQPDDIAESDADSGDDQAKRERDALPEPEQLDEPQ